MWTTSWSIKVSKLCNLRCRYCYEWEELANPERISLAQWAKILSAIKRYHELQSARFGEPGTAQLHWHGGEPLLLPIEYFESVLRLENDIIGTQKLQNGQFVNALQTNLYSLPEPKLDFLRREKFEFCVSLDVVDGQRQTISGGDTNRRVIENMRRLASHNVPFCGTVVLAGHTKSRLREIYDFYERLGVRFTIFPLSASPLNRDGVDFDLAESEITEALKNLFVHWIDRGTPIAVQPLKTYFETALLHMAGLERPIYDRNQNAEQLLIVNTEGSLYTLADRYAPGMLLGNVFEQSIEEILVSTAYRASLDRDSERRHYHCTGCPCLGACDTYPLFSEVHFAGSRRCRTAFELIAFIERYLKDAGFKHEDLKDTVLESCGINV